MKKEIKLNEQYQLILKLSYVKNCSTGEKYYEIRSKIVDIKDYKTNKDCIGEVQGAYFYKIKVYTPKIFRAWNENVLEKRIKKAVFQIIDSSKSLVSEWENRERVMANINDYIDNIE